MLHINPEMIPRLEQLEADLETRRARAVAEKWVGEVEGIDLTLRFLRDKRMEAQRVNRTAQKSELGLPLMPAPKPRGRPRRPKIE